MNGRSLTGSSVMLAGMLVLAGCGDRPGYNATTVESYLVSSQAATFAPAGQVGKASCPEDLKLREGMTFTCKLIVSGAKVPYRVRLTHVDSGKVSIAAAPDGVLLSGTKLRDFVRSTLPSSSATAGVDCGGAYVVARIGKPMPCTLTLGPQEKPIKVTVKDESGSVRISS